jgi:hypothetical protein
MNLLAYCPIDLPHPDIRLEVLREFVNQYGFDHNTGYWRVGPLIGCVENFENWSSLKYQKLAWAHRYNPDVDKLRYFPGMDSYFPNLKPFLSTLPFQLITYCVVLKQIEPVPAHFDIDYGSQEEVRVNSSIDEPSLYKLLYQNFEAPSFFLSTEERKDVFEFPRRPPNHHLFAITESVTKHGAKLVAGLEKYVISIFGILDLERHRKLIHRSQMIFPEYTIRVTVEEV